MAHTTPARRAVAAGLGLLYVAFLLFVALTPSGPRSIAPAAAPTQHTTPPFVPPTHHGRSVPPKGISGYTTYLPEGPQVVINFWKGQRHNLGFTKVSAQFDKAGHPTITIGSDGEPQVTNIQRGIGTSVVIGSKASAQVPFLTGTSKYGSFVVTFLLTDNGKWLEPRFTLQNQAGCTNGIKIAPTNGTVFYVGSTADFGPSGPQVNITGRHFIVTGLGFSTNAPYSPYGDVMWVSRDYTTANGSAHLGFAWHHGAGDPSGERCDA